ncbi:hypothetical protein JVU11DRAFT_11851 [Chiua virens]|nr:hypothetical protein JVU11DRAFT_11851 [Chiua virens]
MSTDDRSLLGSVFERTTLHPPSVSSSRFTPIPGTGFPTAQHRFKSAFARARDGAISKGNGGVGRQNCASSIVSTQSIDDPKPVPTNADALRRQIQEENARKIERMSDKEIEEERRSILDQMGDGTVELLKRVQAARWRKEQQEKEAVVKEQPIRAVQRETEDVSSDRNNEAHQTAGPDSDSIPIMASPSPRRVSQGLAVRPSVLRVKSLDNITRPAPSPLPATSSTRPSSRTSRKLRFAEVTPDDVHIYESAPVSPKRTVLALPPPPDTKDDSIVSLGTFHNHTVPSKRPHPIEGPTEDQLAPASKDDDELEEGTPEYIRRRYFPNVPANDPNLAWMEMSFRETNPSSPRFDLHGAPIPASISSSLPSHLGLHHHAEGSHAGYTIDDIFLLSRSTVPAQRASMLGILARIAYRLGRQVREPDNPDKIFAFAGQEGELRKRILAAGLTAIDQIGSLGARAVEIVWACLVEWDRTAKDLDDIELSLAPDVVSSLQLDYFLPQVTVILSHAALPAESLEQLLAVIHWLSQQSNKVADMITTTPRLVAAILNTFLLTPIPPKEDSLPPNPVALQLLITLASASRSNASALLDPADALLRFIAILPSSSPYSQALAATLLTYTLRFYATLASYGLYAHIATTASPVFSALALYILSPAFVDSTSASESASDSVSTRLRASWASLLEAWTICATNPHATRPPHEILWSQVSAWGWATDIRKLKEGLGTDRPHWPAYAAIWDAEAAWLEGARINSVKGGEGEREEVLRMLRVSFNSGDGTELGVVRGALEAIQHDLGQVGPTGERVLKSLASGAAVLASSLRLFIACLPPLNNSTLLSAPPFALPLSELSALSATLVKHSIWSLPDSPGAAYLRTYLRPLTRFIIHFHRVSRYIPGTNPQLWFAQALVFLPRLLPGDESHGFAMLDSFSHVTPQFVGANPAELPQDVDVDVLRPFLEYTVRPEGDVYVAPLRPSTESISRSSTLRLPSPSSSSGSVKGDDPDMHTVRTFSAGLPLTRDFLFAPLTHLLRSGASPVFRALPAKWTASEVDVVRATLMLALAARRVLAAHGLEGCMPDAAEVVFACMRVCMLEHGVGFGGTAMEVYRDDGVERLMSLLLAPLTMRGGDPPSTDARTLEDASKPYLDRTPFYQFYTDLVALYGAVSFGHRIFATLVVTPLAMRYPVDYRRALWCGGDGPGAVSKAGPGNADTSEGGGALADVVRSVRISIDEVVCTVIGDVREYLYPVERDAGVLGAYVAALVTTDRGQVDGFLRLVAVHHVACTVWADLGEGIEEGQIAATRARLLRVVLVHGGADVVKDVVLYRQRAWGAFVLPPTCYQGGEDGMGDGGWREERVAFVQRSMGESVAERVGTLLKR